MRTLSRDKLGPEVRFIVLQLEKDLQVERLQPRKGIFGDYIELWTKMKFDPVGDDEENAVDLKISKDMQLDDVVKMVMQNI